MGGVLCSMNIIFPRINETYLHPQSVVVSFYYAEMQKLRERGRKMFKELSWSEE